MDNALSVFFLFVCFFSACFCNVCKCVPLFGQNKKTSHLSICSVCGGFRIRLDLGIRYFFTGLAIATTVYTHPTWMGAIELGGIRKMYLR